MGERGDARWIDPAFHLLASLDPPRVGRRGWRSPCSPLGAAVGTQRALDGDMPPRCPHGRQRYYCKECGGGGICEHGRRRSKCKECGSSSKKTILLEATVVEVDEDAEPDEWIPTVQSYILVAAGPRGGKRKR